MNHITFVSYTGAWPSLCAGILTLIIDGETVTFGPSTSVEKPMYDRFWRSGGYDFDLVLVTEDGRVVITDGIAGAFVESEESGYSYEVVS